MKNQYENDQNLPLLLYYLNAFDDFNEDSHFIQWLLEHYDWIEIEHDESNKHKVRLEVDYYFHGPTLVSKMREKHALTLEK